MKPVVAKKLQSKLEETLGKAPASLEMRLTPLTSQLDNGARLQSVSGTTFGNSSEVAPGGVHYLFGDDTNGSWISLNIPTEVGKLYVVDCRALEYDWQWDEASRFRDGALSIRLGTSGDYADLVTIDGHVVWAFSATAATSDISLFYWGDSGAYSRFLAWWGCDVGKAN